MNDNVTDRLTESLRRQAGQVASGQSFADAARGRARRIRRRRRVTAGAATLLALAIAIPFGLIAASDSGIRKTEMQPVETPTRTPTQTPTVRPEPIEQPTTIDLDIDELSKGESPEIPWYYDGVIHDDDEEISIGKLPVETAEVNFARTPAGYLVRITEDICCGGDSEPGRWARLITASGEQTELPSGVTPVVSKDGQTLAWADPTSQNRTDKRLFTASAETGEVLDESPVVARANTVDVLGFVDGLVVFSSDKEGSGFTATWDPETGGVTDIDGVQGGEDVRSDGLLLAWLSSTSGECLGAVDLATGGDGVRWQDCKIPFADFSGDGGYAVAAYEGKLFDPSTGKLLMRLRHEGMGGLVDLTHFQTEPDGDILFRKTMPKQNSEVLVRCDTDGECELASGVYRADVYPDPAYALID